MKILLAAIETAAEHAVVIERAKAPFLLTSFFYARKTAAMVPWVRALQGAQLRFADSGAFTLRTSVLSVVGTSGAASAAGVDYDKYLAEYLAWLRIHSRAALLDVWVELDLGAIVGLDWVHAQRKAYQRAGLSHGLVNVWHSDNDWDYWLYLLREAKQPGRSNYVAIEGHQLNRPALDYGKFLHAAYQRGVRVHGFKMTALEDLRRYPFYSVDSSSWLSPTRTGQIPYIDRLGGVTNRKKMRAHEPQFRAAIMHQTSSRAPKRAERLVLLDASARAWVQASHQLTAIWKRRGVFWDAAIASPEVTDE